MTIRRVASRKWIAALAALAGLLTSATRAEDVVILSSPTKTEAFTRLSGEVLDFTGRGLRWRMANGRELEYPALQVLRIETTRSPQQLAGDELFKNDEFAAAEDKYRAALTHEKRDWVRRELLAASVRCQRELGNWPGAARIFEGLVTSDPDTIYVEVAPLAWEGPRTIDATPTVESAAALEMMKCTEGWLNDRAPRPLQLVAASWHLGTPRDADAVAAFQRLTQAPASHVGPLANVQVQRYQFSALTPTLIDRWEHMLSTYAQAWCAGGWHMVGTAASRLGLQDRAALAWLRIPALYADQRQLGARAELAAADALAAADRTAEASRLCEHVVAQYSRLDAARDAQKRLEALRPKEEAPP